MKPESQETKVLTADPVSETPEQLDRTEPKTLHVQNSAPTSDSADAVLDADETTQARKQNRYACFRCASNRAYYVVEGSQFVRSPCGFCMRHHKTVYNRETCAHWESGHYQYGIKKRVSLRVLYELLTKISGIRQILQEAQDASEDRT